MPDPFDKTLSSDAHSSPEGFFTYPEKLTDTYQIDNLQPKIISIPRTPEEAANFLQRANSEGLRVSIWGGGTRVRLGNPLAGLDAVLSTRNLNKITDYTPADLVVGVQAGMRVADLQTELRKHNQFLPIESPMTMRGATIGGAIATNSSGPTRLRYGPARDWLIGVKYILADGAMAKAGGKVVKNVAGYDMMKLFVGSMGTLGLIHEMYFKLMPLPTTTATIALQFPDTYKACKTALQIIDAGLFPAALTVLDRNAARRLKTDAKDALLVIELQDTKAAVERQTHSIIKLAQPEQGQTVDLPQIWQPITDFGYLDATGNEIKFTLKIGVLPALCADFMDKAHELAAQFKLEVEVIAHAGHGICWLTAGNDSNAADLIEFTRILRNWVEMNGGSLVIERAVLNIKQALDDVWGSVLSAGELKLMRGLKEKFDPKRTLNAGRFVGGI